VGLGSALVALGAILVSLPMSSWTPGCTTTPAVIQWSQSRSASRDRRSLRPPPAPADAVRLLATSQTCVPPAPYPSAVLGADSGAGWAANIGETEWTTPGAL